MEFDSYSLLPIALCLLPLLHHPVAAGPFAASVFNEALFSEFGKAALNGTQGERHI